MEAPEYWGFGATTIAAVDKDGEGDDWPVNQELVVGDVFRHAGGTRGNFAFADGHAESLSAELRCTAWGEH